MHPFFSYTVTCVWRIFDWIKQCRAVQWFIWHWSAVNKETSLWTHFHINQLKNLRVHCVLRALQLTNNVQMILNETQNPGWERSYMDELPGVFWPSQCSRLLLYSWLLDPCIEAAQSWRWHYESVRKCVSPVHEALLSAGLLLSERSECPSVNDCFTFQRRWTLLKHLKGLFQSLHV